MTEHVEFEGQFANVRSPWRNKWVKRAALSLAGVIPVTALVMTLDVSAAECAGNQEYYDIQPRNLNQNELGWTRLKVENNFGIGPSWSDTSEADSHDQIRDFWGVGRTCADNGTTFLVIFHRYEEGGTPRVVHWRTVEKCIDTNDDVPRCVG